MNKCICSVIASVLSVTALAAIAGTLFVPNLKPFPDNAGANGDI